MMQIKAKRFDDKNVGIFSHINIWLNEHLIGNLTPDVADADAVVKAINMADAAEGLLAACKAVLNHRECNIGTHTYRLIGAAIAKAEESK